MVIAHGASDDSAGPESSASSGSLDIRMPGATSKEEDEYWCTIVDAPKNSFITSFDAIPEGEKTHHMMLFSCPDMTRGHKAGDKWPCHSTCSNSKIMFAWARHADPTILPKDVGFVVGTDETRYIALQIHYRVKVPEPDYSGIRIQYTTETPKYLGGIFIMWAYGGEAIPPHKEKFHMDVSCKFTGETAIYPFAYRVHAHAMARVITGYQFNSSWNLVGRGNPQWPQAFYPVTEKIRIKPNDFLFARCTYNSMDKDKPVLIGSTHNDEMCNFYMMYYTDPTKGRPYYSCGYNKYADILEPVPADSDVPPPPNPALEEKGGGHHHHIMGEDVAEEEGKKGEGKEEGGKKEESGDHRGDMGRITGIQEVKDWADIAPEYANLGQVAGVSTDNAGNVVIFQRGSTVWDPTSFGVLDNVYKHKDKGPIKEKAIITFDPKGKVVNKWGENLFYIPHGIHVDLKNNIWVTDVALHQVMRFPAGTHTADMVLGEQFVPGHDASHFCKPTGVATLSNGQFFISDGYCNHRIIKYSADGKVLKEWGVSSTSIAEDGFPPPSAFSNPHSITLQESLGLLCVADRENERIQCFDLEGNFQRQMHKPDIVGKIFAVSFSGLTGDLYAINGLGNYNKKIELVGYTLDASTGKLINTWAPNSQSFSMPHDVTVSHDGHSVYVTEIHGSHQLWKFNITRDDGVHLAQKKGGRPATIDESSGDNNDDVIISQSDFGASLIIGGLLVIPVVIIVIVTIVLRLKKNAVNSETKYQKIQQGEFEIDSDEEIPRM